MTNIPIFGLRHQANEDVQPTREELEHFLESPKEERSAAKHRDDLTLYLDDLKIIDDFESNLQRGLAECHIDKRKFLGVLSHARFFNHALKRVIEEYKYLYGKLRVLDFKKPRDFVRAVQKEIDTLDPERKVDQPKIARLQAKLDKRNEDIETIEKTRRNLTVELRNIASYVHDNLVRIQKLCELSIATLSKFQVDNEIEKDATEDLKKQFKDELRDRLQQGPVSREFAEQSKEDFVRHAKELSDLALQDRRALTCIYEQVLGHVKKYVAELDTLVRQVETKNGMRFEEERDILGKVGQGLISFISDYQFGVEKDNEIAHKDEHERLIALKRNEVLHRVFDLLQGKPGASH